MTTTETVEPFDRLMTLREAAAAINFTENAQILPSCGLKLVAVGDSTFVRESDLRKFTAALRLAVAREVAGFENVRRHVAEAEAAE
jgi:hypothetical protein